NDFTAVGVVLAGLGFGVVLQRLLPAYHGLISLLDLNVTMAKAEALSHDRSMSDALEAQARQSSNPAVYNSHP
ncbi:MAG: hypothetical protein ACYDD1_09025, partial [Caulobacteraceae bacterium]